MAERDVRDEIRRHFEEGVINEEEFLLLGEAANELEDDEDRVDDGSKWRDFDPFSFEFWTIEECWVDLRFRKADVLRLIAVLGLGDDIVTYNRVRCESVEAVCLLLRRLAFLCRYTDLMPKFGRPKATLCSIFNHMLSLVYDRFSHFLNSFDQALLSRANLAMFAEKVHAKGAPLANCWGFTDGTVRPIVRPGEHQRLMYNGRKRLHGFKFQSVVAPNGLIANLFGPLEGSRHDNFLLQQSGFLLLLERHSFNVDGEVLCVYGDPAYPLSPHLQAGFKNPTTAEEVAYNQAMTRVRVAVEWVLLM